MRCGHSDFFKSTCRLPQALQRKNLHDRLGREHKLQGSREHWKVLSWRICAAMWARSFWGLGVKRVQQGQQSVWPSNTFNPCSTPSPSHTKQALSRSSLLYSCRHSKTCNFFYVHLNAWKVVQTSYFGCSNWSKEAQGLILKFIFLSDLKNWCGAKK